MHFIYSDIFAANSHFACYFAQDGEIETQLIIDNFFLHKKKCYLPKLEDQHMLFALYRSGDPLIPNRYNISEPILGRNNARDPKDMDVIMVPLVGFDAQGHRLGMGGGFYDRTLSSLQLQKRDKPMIIGLAFECQRVALVPTEPWDVPLDAVLTEKGLIVF